MRRSTTYKGKSVLLIPGKATGQKACHYIILLVASSSSLIFLQHLCLLQVSELNKLRKWHSFLQFLLEAIHGVALCCTHSCRCVKNKKKGSL